jgi:two-component system, chemotaxis family, chemotaxis protein CheY
VKTIMTVDDSASVRKMLSVVLQTAGFAVLEATDGPYALSQLDGREIALILSDINMPLMNGLELTREVRSLAHYRFTPIVLLTSESAAEKRQEAKQAGATAWMVKPFNPDQLLAVVAKVVR